MKSLLSAFFMCLVAIAAMAQNQADIIVSYDYTNPDNKGEQVTSKMSLLASPTEAKYFNDLSLWVDSLKSTPEGKAQYMEIIKKTCLTIDADGVMNWDLRKGPVKKVHTYIFTNFMRQSLS